MSEKGISLGIVKLAARTYSHLAFSADRHPSRDDNAVYLQREIAKPVKIFVITPFRQPLDTIQTNIRFQIYELIVHLYLSALFSFRIGGKNKHI